MRYLLVDIGSTYTKVTYVDATKRIILGQAKSITTIKTSVINGFKNALKEIEDKIGKVDYDKVLTCSSAAGGLKMVAVGLGANLTAEASKRAALGAGARVLKTFSYELDDKKIKEIEELNPDIILLSGGTNFGNKFNIIHNAKMLSKLNLNVPIVIAGNEQVSEQVAKILNKFEIHITENVMPTVNELNANPTRSIIRKVFMDRITLAKGLFEYKKEIGEVLMPTPDAALQAARLLSEGTANGAGMGNLILIDIGGATTDVHSIGFGLPTGDVRFEGLKEPFDKRTVEGDLGMRYSAVSLYESVGEDELKEYYDADYKTECKRRSEDIMMVPKRKEDKNIDASIAKACVNHSVDRHVGKIRKEYSNGRYIYYQSGKDLSNFNTIIGTGGVLVHSENPKKILELSEKELYPKNSKYYLDKDYILSSMGLLATEDKETALDIMKKHIKEIK